MKPYPEHIDGSRVTVAEFQGADDDVLIAMECDGLRKRFQGGEAFAILEAHRVAVQAGYTPPAWALEALSDAFSRCLDLDDPQSLDAMLGLKAPGKGKPLPIRERAKKRERHRRAFEIHRLVGCLEIEPWDAARMVLAREAREHAAGKLPSIDWLAEDYVRKYRDRWKPPAEIARIMRPAKEFFDRYPRDSWPRKALVKYLRAQYTSRSSI